MIALTNDLIKLNEKLVYSIVNKFSNKYNEEDLYQVGMMAITKAAKKYDKNKNVKFSTFAYTYILGEVLKYISEDRSVTVSREVVNNYTKIMKAKDYVYKTYGRNISNEELAELTGIDSNKINEIINACIKPERLDSSLNEDNKDSLIDTIKYEENLGKTDLINLKDAINNLSTEEKKYLYNRYFEDKTQSEIAKEKNISQVKTYRYERNILDKLKEKIAS